MNSQTRRQTAQIFQFPPPGARSPRGRALQANPKQKSVVFEAATSDCAGAWYHEAAILESDRLRKP